jgi:hypothetical protein
MLFPQAEPHQQAVVDLIDQRPACRGVGALRIINPATLRNWIERGEIDGETPGGRRQGDQWGLGGAEGDATGGRQTAGVTSRKVVEVMAVPTAPPSESICECGADLVGEQDGYL